MARLSRQLPVAMCLALALCWTSTGCEDDTSTPASDDSPTTAEDVRDLIESGAQQWLSGFAELTPLTCPPGSNAVITSTDASVQACVVGGAQQFVVRVQNRTTVPMSVWGSDVLHPFTVLPQATLDLAITNPQFGQYLSFQADAVAGLTSVVVQQVQDELDEARVPGYGWVTCAVRPDPDCLVSAIADLLPDEVVIRGYRIPVGLLGQGLSLAYQNRALLASFAGDFAGRPPGQLTLTPA